jgi:hypothetical protein
MSYRKFSERLNQALDDIGVPEDHDERVEALTKLVSITKFKADAVIAGKFIPDSICLNSLAQQLEVEPDWLLGKIDD